MSGLVPCYRALRHPYANLTGRYARYTAFRELRSEMWLRGCHSL